MEAIKNSLSNVKLPEINAQSLSANANAGIQNAAASVTAAKESLQNSLKDFSSQNAVNAGKDFLASNSIIAKFVFLILVVIAFLILMRFGIFLINYFTSAVKNPYVIKGLLPGNSNIVITQDPKIINSVTLQRSNNKSSGMEFTWSVWLNVQGITSSATTAYSQIFNKGNSVYDATTGIATVNNAPGVYISNSKNDIRIVMDMVTKDNQVNYIDCTGIPLKKWFHLAVRLQNTMMDVYVNGVITGRLQLVNVPKQNYSDIFIGYNGGFNGQLSNLAYYSKALGVFDINNLILQGPNMTQSSAVVSNIGNYSYLSNLWYFNKLDK
jgi:hypothetical protein